MGSVNPTPGAKRPRVEEGRAGGDAIGGASTGHAPSPLLQHLQAATHEAQRQHEARLSLEAQAKETVNELSCLQTRYCQLVQQYDALQEQHSEAAEELAALKQQQQPPASSPDGADTAGRTLPPSQAPEPKQPSQAPRRTAPAAPPPVLALEASRLLPGADPEVGYCTSDLEQAAHDFGAFLSATAAQHAKKPYLPEAVKYIKACLLGNATREHCNRAVLTSLDPCFLGHFVMHWMGEQVWPDPLALLGCPLGLALGPLTHGSGEANLLSLIRSHAARRWCEVTKAMVAGAGGSSCSQPTAGAVMAAAGATGRGGTVDGACVCVEQVVSRLTVNLMGWLRTFPDLVAAMESDPHIPALLLRALHLGLFALAAHPLMRVRVSPVVSQLPHGAQYLQPLCDSQAERRCITLSTGRGSPNAPLGAKHVLCSLQPGIGFWAAAEGTGAGPERHVVVREEVITWEWVKPSGWKMPFS